MSATTIQVPADQIDAIRKSLLSVRYELASQPFHRCGGGSPTQRAGMTALDPREQLQDVEEILEQLTGDAPLPVASIELTGSRKVLWNAAYDALCEAAEGLAEDCNEYWRGVIHPVETRARIAEIGARFDLLDALGAPPGER